MSGSSSRVLGEERVTSDCPWSLSGYARMIRLCACGEQSSRNALRKAAQRYRAARSQQSRVQIMISQTMQQRVQSVQERIRQACERVGRDPAQVSILPVSKTFPVESIEQ